MDDPIPTSHETRREFRTGPLGTDGRRDLRSAVVLSVVLAWLPVNAALQNLDRPVVVGLGLAIAAGLPLETAWKQISDRRERVVVTDEAIELWRWRTARPRRRVLRIGALRGARLVLQSGWRDVRPHVLVLSDGRKGLRLDSYRWESQLDAIIVAAGLEAPYVDRSDAQRRCPEAFGWWGRLHPVAAALLALTIAAAVVVVATRLP